MHDEQWFNRKEDPSRSDEINEGYPNGGADHRKYSGMYDASSSKLKANVISI